MSDRKGVDPLFSVPTQKTWVDVIPELRPYDFTRFDRLMQELQDWRSADHEDNITLCRSHVIAIIEGVKAIRAV